MVKYKRIFNRTIAVKLQLMGNKIYKMETNKYHPDYQIYLFYDTPLLQQSLSIIRTEDKSDEDLDIQQFSSKGVPNI